MLSQPINKRLKNEILMKEQKKVSAQISAAAENYWDYVPAMLSSALRSDRNLDEYLLRYRGLIDFGISPTQLSEISNKLPVIPKEKGSLKLLFVSDWIKHFIHVVTKKDERERLLIKEKKLAAQMKITSQRLLKLQAVRSKLLDSTFDFSEYRGRAYKQLINSLPLIDKIKYDSLIKNEASGRGRYFGVEERRTFAAERQWVAQQERKIEALLSLVEERETKHRLNSTFQEVNEILELKLDIRRQTDLAQERRAVLEEEIASIPIEKITAQISQKVLRLKGIITDEIDRVGGRTGEFRQANEPIINLGEINDELKRIIEFDREMFANNFANRHGRPTVLLVPGEGDGMYDHVDNIFIIPIVPTFNLGESLASAIIAYRLYHDDSKQFIRSYGRIPINENSVGFTLRAQLVKSYSKWVTMEYDGYRVLDKDERLWFAKFCAPKRVDFYYPYELVRGGIHGEEYDDLIEKISAGLKSGIIKNDDLWLASVIACKRGDYDKAEARIKKLIEKSSEYIFAYFNLGVLLVKACRNKEAITVFKTFIDKAPPKWWGGVAQEHIVVLKHDAKKKKA